MSEKSELDELLQSLRNIKNNKSDVKNSKETWSYIGQGDWEGAGFQSEEEMKEFVLANPYANL